MNLATIYLEDIARQRGVDEPIFRSSPKKDSERETDKVVPSAGKSTGMTSLLLLSFYLSFLSFLSFI